MEKNILSRALNSLPIKWGYYINKDKQKQKTIFVGHEKAIYDANGRQLDSKLIDIQDSVSDAFLETKAYSAGNYTIYLNRLYKFTTAKPAGPWDGSKVVPVSVAGELAQLYGNLAIPISGVQLSKIQFEVVESSDRALIAFVVDGNLVYRVDFNGTSKFIAFQKYNRLTDNNWKTIGVVKFDS